MINRWDKVTTVPDPEWVKDQEKQLNPPVEDASEES